jgi:antirestriction protein ArdC
MKTQLKNTAAKDVYQIVSDKIIACLEQGSIPWRKSWHSATACNYVTGKAYRGINAFLLNMEGSEHSYYLTFKQATDLGGRIKKGAKAEMITYWNWVYTDKQTGKKLSPEQCRSTPANRVNKAAFLKYYHVFNVSDTEGIEFSFPQPTQRPLPEKLAVCEQLIKSIPNPPAIQFGGQEAFYSPTLDRVTMPHIKHFESAEFYYSVFFHELVHATGHHKRLARKAEGQQNRFGSELYSKEELIAELGACFLCAFTEIEQQTLENSAAYIQNWLQVLKDDKRFIVEAAGKAQQAADYLMGAIAQPVEAETLEAA